MGRIESKMNLIGSEATKKSEKKILFYHAAFTTNMRDYVVFDCGNSKATFRAFRNVPLSRRFHAALHSEPNLQRFLSFFRSQQHL